MGGLVVQAISSSPYMSLPIIGTIKSWQAPFFIVGLPGLLVAALRYTVKEPKRREQISDNSEQKNEVVSLREAFDYIGNRWKIYLSHFFGFALLGVSSNVLFVWGPHILVRSFGTNVGSQTGPLSDSILVHRFGQKNKAPLRLQYDYFPCELLVYGPKMWYTFWFNIKAILWLRFGPIHVIEVLI